MFEYFYHEILRKTIISFGTLFNGIEIKHKDSSDAVTEVIKVPLAYGPTQKFLARLEQSADLSKSTQISLPRMSFEFTGLQYDSSRKVSTTQTFLTTNKTGDKSVAKKAYMPVPYNMAFELSVYTKLNDDMLQIVEQILPYFQPQFNLTVDLVESIGEKRDIPVVLENITMQDDYEGDFTTRRSLYYTFRFTAKTYLYGPVSTATGDIIKKVQVGYIAGGVNDAPTRDITYSVEPRAVKNYTGSSITTLSQDVGSTAKYVEVADTSGIADASFFTIDNELMYVLDVISSTKLKVERGRDGTTKAAHVAGADLHIIDSADNALIEMGDDFGFDGSTI